MILNELFILFQKIITIDKKYFFSHAIHIF